MFVNIVFGGRGVLILGSADHGTFFRKRRSLKLALFLDHVCGPKLFGAKLTGSRFWFGESVRDADHGRFNEGNAALICGCKPLWTTKNSEAKGTPQLVLTTKKQRGQRLENHIKPIIKPIGKTHKTVKTEPFLKL